MDGGLDPASQAADLSAVEPNTGPTSMEACNLGPRTHPAVGRVPPTLELVEPGWAPVMEFTPADIFQHSPFGDMLNSLKSLSLSGDSGPNYVRLSGKQATKEFGAHPPPTSLPRSNNKPTCLTPKTSTVWTTMQEKLQNPWGAGLLPGHTIYTW